MATITVDVDLDDFDLDELLNEVKNRCNCGSNKNKIDEWAKDFLKKERFEKKLSAWDEMMIQLIIDLYVTTIKNVHNKV